MLTSRAASVVAVLLVALAIASSALAPRIAQAQTSDGCTEVAFPQESVCNLHAPVLKNTFIGYWPSSSAHFDVANGFTTGAAATGYNLHSVHVNVARRETNFQ